MNWEVGGTLKKSIALGEGWELLQDVHDLGERFGLYSPECDPTRCGAGISPWEPIDRLDYLQILLSETPYFGRDLRSMNQAPWWYRTRFTIPDKAYPDRIILRIYGCDYFCKVWLNGQLLGGHEGYFDTFSFDVTALVLPDQPQVLIVKVWSPWDTDVLNGMYDLRFTSVVRNQMKGTYEHADTFIQRDVNPVGLWGKVEVLLYRYGRITDDPEVRYQLSGDHMDASVTVTFGLEQYDRHKASHLRCSLLDVSGIAVASQDLAVDREKSTVTCEFRLRKPLLWNMWERGKPNLYSAEITLFGPDGPVDVKSLRFGLRDVGLIRSERETYFECNGSRVFVRGTSYFPEVYLSRMGRQRYYRDLLLMKQAGFNTVRVHVHVEKPDFYDLCDELGMMVIQDSDLNWTHPADEGFRSRAADIFSRMVVMLRHHPSICCWVCVNEPDLWKVIGDHSETEPCASFYEPLADALTEILRTIDPRRPYIKGSYLEDDPESGDSHTYLGSINGPDSHYTDIFPVREKLNTEFGVDAPPCVESIQRSPRLWKRLNLGAEEIESIQDYQSRLIQYYMEHYRMRKYRPCSGYVQFMFIDLCPQSFMGIYDWWGVPKKCLRVIEKSNQPVGVFMEHTDAFKGLWVVNDSPTDLGRCKAAWRVVDQHHVEVESGSHFVDVGPDSVQRVPGADHLQSRESCTIRLELFHDDELIAENVYEDPFVHPRRREGHPRRMDHELGMRLF